jgi:tetratricopeptide (TPR) repeat protein
MGTFRLALAAFIVLLSRGSAAAEWVEYRTEHFILDTDAPDVAELMMATLEKARATDMAVLAGGELELLGRIRVVAPKSEEQFQEIAGNTWSAAFYTHGPREEPIVLGPVKAFFDSPENLPHELAHAVSHYLFPEQPHWYAEGLAMFVQTIAQRPASTNPPNTGSHVVRAPPGAPISAVGAVPAGVGRFLRGPAVPAVKILAWRAQDPEDPERYYAFAWLLYHYLWNERSMELTAFQKRLLDGEGFDKAWLATFPDLDPANAAQLQALDAALAQYLKAGKFVMAKIKSEPQFKMSREEVSRADVRLWLLHLRQSWPDKQTKAAARRAQMAKALLEDPNNPEALLTLALLDGKLTPEAARAAANGAPKDFRGWYLLAGVATDAKEKESALRKAVTLGDECPACNDDLAWLLATSGRAKEALTFANHALDLAPWDASAVDTMAEVAAQLGQCPQALQLQARAVSMAKLRGGKSAELDERMQTIQSRCATKPAGK